MWMKCQDCYDAKKGNCSGYRTIRCCKKIYTAQTEMELKSDTFSWSKAAKPLQQD